MMSVVLHYKYFEHLEFSISDLEFECFFFGDVKHKTPMLTYPVRLENLNLILNFIYVHTLSIRAEKAEFCCSSNYIFLQTNRRVCK